MTLSFFSDQIYHSQKLNAFKMYLERTFSPIPHGILVNMGGVGFCLPPVTFEFVDLLRPHSAQ